MRFEASQHMRMGQHMKLAPRMIQSMEILQMPLHELEERIEQELESNATLELADGGDDGGKEDWGDTGGSPVPPGDEGGETPAPMVVDEGSGREDFERLESFEEANPDVFDSERGGEDGRPEPGRVMQEYAEGLGGARSRLEGERDAKSEAMANTAARAASVQEQLLDQWRLVDVEERLRPLGELIISYIEDDGYLRTPLETIADRAPEGAGGAGGGAGKPSRADLERALLAVQLLLEPAGVGARDVRESLLLQIDAMGGSERDSDTAIQRDRGGIEGCAGDWGLVRRIVEGYLEDLGQNRLPRIAEKLGVSVEAVKGAVERMRCLSLAPGRWLVQSSEAAIVPDATVEWDEEQPGGGRYVAYLNESRMANLRINQEYARLAKDRGAPKATREFLKKNLNNASWLMDAVEQRRRTLLRVLNVVVEAQREYFDYGPAHLKPLPMTGVAEQLGIHVGTVSRAVAEKYVATPRGVVPLRGFFTGGTHTESGEEVSWDAVKAALKEVVDAEDKKNPLSDEALAEEVKKRGVEIARRTVAKYRDQLGIPAARLRKVY